MGEGTVNPPAQSQTKASETTSESSKKYQDLTNDQNELYRETTMASVSNVAMAGYDSSRLNSAASIRTNDGLSGPEKNFEADF